MEKESELAKTYDHSQENKIYQLWEKNGAFQPNFEFRNSNLESPYFSMVMPPPNVTGSLHMGHALNTVCQDILARYYRLQGKAVKWVVGTDHAGIATQTVVEKNLLKKGIKARELPKEKFIEYIWRWKEQYGSRIIEQLQKLGASCDYSKVYFTMNDDYKQAVETAFKHFYDKGWIYQADRVVNWCVRCQTSLSDLELEYAAQKTKLYFFKYDKDFPIVIATTRPETKLGDSAVAINPKDKRYQKYIGKEYKVDFLGVPLTVKIISDPMVDLEFGSGALGVTPAHSLADQELAQKHGLELRQVIDQFGKINQNGGQFAWLKVKEAREKIVEKLEKKGLLEKVEETQHNLSVCYRCTKEIEPIPSRQWFMKMGEIKQPAIEAVKSGKITFSPKKWEKIYLDWMEHVRDWCISRQLVWGHKIPIKGETDVLDTWFSSALWAIATLGYPQKIDSRFYPTAVLSTARDIINLWVARMIFCSLELTGEIPFGQVYIHPTIFNREGKRMSKSLGTGVDPMELIKRYGADATRFGLTYINTGVQDLRFDEEAIKAGQKFANKIWNIARYCITQFSIFNFQFSINFQIPNDKMTKNDKEILEKLEKTEKLVKKDIDNFRFGQAAHTLYDFVWHDLADIYIEASKKQLQNPKTKGLTLYILHLTLIASLKLLHPFMPFVTEAIWQELYRRKLVSEKLLINAKI